MAPAIIPESQNHRDTMELYPLRFKPVFRSYIWGGRRLGGVLGKPIGDGPRYAESWEVVDHGEDQSVVENGPLAGRTLGSLVQEMGTDLLGQGQAAGGGTFPLLFKYLDCDRVLSVQVHPDDAYAATMDPPDRGKTEAWYVIDAEPGSLIYAGLRPGVDRETFATAIGTGRVADVLNTITATPGDCIFIPAGTVHALGAGILVAEIQQSSDTTFRVFDWNRLGDDGRRRPLHVNQALEVTNYATGPISPQRSEAIDGGGERLVDCDKFVLDRYTRGQPVALPGGRFRILTTVEGGANLVYGDQELRMGLGQSALVPASVERVELVPFGSGATVLSMQQGS